MDQAVLPLLTLLGGTLLGLFSSLLLTTIRQRQALTMRLLDQYFEVRKEIVTAVSELTTLDVYRECDQDWRLAKRDKITELYYRHYDFLPRAATDALLLLQAALSDGRGKLYWIWDKRLLPLSGRDQAEFVRQSSMFDNTRHFSTLALNSRKPNIRCNQAIKLHSRYVLYTLNKYASIDELLAMTKRLRKSIRLSQESS